MKVTKNTIVGAVAFIASGAAAYAAVDEYRWWPWRSEFIELAGTAYQTAINQKWDQLIYIERQLRSCQEQRNEDCSGLRRQQQRLQDEIRRLEAERDKYQGG